MFSKTLFLIVLFCAAVIINADPEPQQSLRVDKVKTYFKQLNNKIYNFIDKASNIWHKFWDRALGIEDKRQNQEIAALKSELEQLQYQSSVQLAAEKAKWHVKLEAQEEELERLREDKEAVAAAKRKLEVLQKQATAAIEGVLQEWDEKADNLGGRIEKVLDA